jgi:metal-dependent amidase/aminoacylase/carboxypeptidase family protein
MVRLGAFDDVDLAMMTHTSTDSKVKGLAVGATFNGMVAKEAEFIGRAAHAGACPWEGINALNAATLAISAIHANRETFREEDTVRVHPIVTRGGDVVNVVPARARIEMFVRGGTLTSIEDTCRKVDRSLKAGAMAVGAKVRIRTLPGYLPMERHDPFNALYRENAEALVGKDRVTVYGHCAASTDMSDITQIMPAIHPYADGVAGVVHGKDYLVRDWDAAVLTPAKAMAFTLVDLLADGARRGKEILAACPPKLTKPQYLRLLRSYLNEEEFE